MDYRQEYEKWCNDPYFDEQTKAELKAIAGDDKEIEDRFYRTLEFGTAGLRGVIGAGTNRMNIYTVRQATQGLANYILAQGGQEKGVAIAHDSRLMADEFTDAAALCLAANGIKTYVFKSLRPVPELSFAVRTLGCIAGIVITASHNPREYNGYKVYWEDGAQVTPPHDTGIMAEVAKVTSFDMVKTMEKEKAQAEGLWVFSFSMVFTMSKEVTFATSAIIPVSCGGVTCAPSSQYTLYPLYSLGLWLAVITIPAIHPSVRTANESSGTGRRLLNTYVLIPFAARQSAAASVNSSAIRRESCAIATPFSCPPCARI